VHQNQISKKFNNQNVFVVVILVLFFGMFLAYSGIASKIVQAATNIIMSSEIGQDSAANRLIADTLDDTWRSTLAADACFQTPVIGDFGAVDATSSIKNVTIGSTNLSFELRDMNGTLPFGVPATTQGNISGYSTLQDNAPKPQSLYSSTFWNENSGSTSNKNALLITFSQNVYSFGAWFGDLETRTDDPNLAAKFKLFDASMNEISSTDVNTSSTMASCGGTFIGCGNKQTKWLSFYGNDPVCCNKRLH
jgi:ABC-type transport system involved in multi-copper enzyme maturation permease subunit